MKAKMKDNLIKRYKKIFKSEKDYDEEIETFLLSIEGKEIELIFTGNDAFEINDNNIWLPNELWEEIK